MKVKASVLNHHALLSLVALKGENGMKESGEKAASFYHSSSGKNDPILLLDQQPNLLVGHEIGPIGFGGLGSKHLSIVRGVLIIIIMFRSNLGMSVVSISNWRTSVFVFLFDRI